MFIIYQIVFCVGFIKRTPVREITIIINIIRISIGITRFEVLKIIEASFRGYTEHYHNSCTIYFCTSSGVTHIEKQSDSLVLTTNPCIPHSLT